MVSRKLVIRNASGLHLRPAGILCNTALRFSSSIKFHVRNSNGNAKSVLSVLGACVKNNDEVEFICEGEDEEEALAAITEAVEGGLGEEITNH